MWVTCHREEVWFIAPPDQSYQYIFSANVLLFLHRTDASSCLCVDPQKPTHRPLCTKGDEVRLAGEASKKYRNPAPTIFSKVIDKSIPADIIYEDEKVRLEPRDSAMYSCIQSITHFCPHCVMLQPYSNTLGANSQSNLGYTCAVWE